MIELGFKVRDIATGFQGYVLGYVRYVTGCNQALVQPPVSESGAMQESYWIDEARLEVTSTRRMPLVEHQTAPGFDKAPPRI